MLFDVAVVIPTTLRPELDRAVRSIFDQDIQGSAQILVGIDRADGDPGMLDELHRDCPGRMKLTVMDLGYSTSKWNGGIYGNWSGGSLRTMLSYAALSRYVAYLDDDNWWAPSHLSDLCAAIAGHAWAYTFRWYVDPFTQQPMGVDAWESVGPGKGVYAAGHGGFVDTNCLMLDKLQCHWVLPAWCVPNRSAGSGVDKILFKHLLRKEQGVCTGKATAYYVIRRKDVEKIRRLVASRPGGA